MKSLGIATPSFIPSRKGFTLVEVIVAITILSIVLVSVFEVYSNIIVMSKRLELDRGLQQNARTIVETIAKDIRNGGIAFECYRPNTTSPIGCNSWPHDREYSGSGSSILILRSNECSGSLDCYAQYYLAKSTATVGEVACDDVDTLVPWLCYISRKLVSNGLPTGENVRLSDTFTSVSQLRFYLSGVSAEWFANQLDQEGKVTLNFTIGLAPRQGLNSETAKRTSIPVQTTITQKLYQASN